MAIDGIYDTGTISVNAGATAVTGVGTAWTTVGITPGDTFEAGGLIGLVESVTDNTHLTLTRAWPGASNLSGAGYQIVENSWQRSAISTAQRQIGRIVNILNGTGYIYPVAAGGTPDNSLGEDGQYAQDFDNEKWWKKVSGVWVLQTHPSFSAYISAASLDNVTGDGTEYEIVFDQESFDLSGNISAGLFTAPVTGKYLLTTIVTLLNLSAANTYGYLDIETSNVVYELALGNVGNMRDGSNTYGVCASVVADMDAGDTAKVTIAVFGSTKVVGVLGEAECSRFMGVLM